MDKSSKLHRYLGIAFLLQFTTSIFNGVVFKESAIGSGSIEEIMNRAAAHSWQVQTYILIDLFTALGIIFLGTALYTSLKKTNMVVAGTALGFYFLEAVLLAVSKAGTFSLLKISQQAASAGSTAGSAQLAALSLEAMNYLGETLHVLVFCLGAILFYALFFKSRIVPRWLSLWGLITLIPLLVGTVLAVFGIEIPFGFYVPYVPFEFVIGVWLLAFGFQPVKAAV